MMHTGLHEGETAPLSEQLEAPGRLLIKTEALFEVLM
jgi:hypothetical protein